MATSPSDPALQFGSTALTPQANSGTVPKHVTYGAAVTQEAGRQKFRPENMMPLGSHFWRTALSCDRFEPK